MKLIFIPISVAGGILAGLVAKKSFEQIWGMIDAEEPPDAEHREISYVKLAAALMLEGAIFRLVRGFIDHGARRTFARATGRWPGQEAPEPE
jgi:Protein of unknown function (DUF4235)